MHTVKCAQAQKEHYSPWRIYTYSFVSPTMFLTMFDKLVPEQLAHKWSETQNLVRKLWLNNRNLIKFEIYGKR